LANSGSEICPSPAGGGRATQSQSDAAPSGPAPPTVRVDHGNHLVDLLVGGVLAERLVHLAQLRGAHKVVVVEVERAERLADLSPRKGPELGRHRPLCTETAAAESAAARLRMGGARR
jgi:hypothetical protein